MALAKPPVISIDYTNRITQFNRVAEWRLENFAQEMLGQPVEILLMQQFADPYREDFQGFG